MKTRATAKFVGTSARKIGLVAALIRGRNVASAETVLAHTSKRATDPVGQVLHSAIANAQNNHNAKKAELFVESVLIGPGPTLKRFRPRAKGAAASIKKRSSHITVVLSDSKPVTKEKAPKKPETKPTKTATPAKEQTAKKDEDK